MLGRAFKDIGVQIYGKEWASQLSEDFGVEPTTIRNWAKGKTQLPKTANTILRAAIKRQIAKLSMVLERIDIDTEGQKK